MKYTIFIDPSFDFLSEDYAKLFASADASAFQSPLWLNNIHKTLIPSLKARQYTIIVKEGSEDNMGKLLAVFPFAIQRAVLGRKMIQFADFGVCDYNCVIGETSTLEALANDKEVCAALAQTIHAGHLLLLRKLRADRFDLGRFFNKAHKTLHDNATYNCSIGSDVQNWKTQKLSKSWLKNLRRTEKKFKKDVGDWHFEKLTTQKQICSAMGVIRDMHQSRFKDSLIKQDIYNDFYTNYVLEAHEKGDVALYALMLDDKTIATEFGFLYDNCYQGILVTADTEHYGKYSPGYQMIFKIIDDIAKEGYQNFDLGLGSQDYKKRFNAEETMLYDLVQELSPSGRVMALTYHYASPLKKILKKYAPHVH